MPYDDFSSNKPRMKMNPDVKQKWIDALRSGKYEQGKEKLRAVSGYCCLGVLCDIYAQEHPTVEWEFHGDEETNLQQHDYWYFNGESDYLSESVSEWAGFGVGVGCECPEVIIHVDEADADNWSHYRSLADLNDSGYTFSDISKLIEEQL